MIVIFKMKYVKNANDWKFSKIHLCHIKVIEAFFFLRKRRLTVLKGRRYGHLALEKLTALIQVLKVATT